MSYFPSAEKCMEYLQANISATVIQDEDQVDDVKQILCEEIEEKSRNANTNTFHRRFVGSSF